MAGLEKRAEVFTMLQKSLFGMLVAGLIVGMLAITACGNSGSPSGTGTPTATVSVAPQDITVTSSVNAGHTHNITISGTDIENPPAGGKTIDTTYNSGHRHTITLTQQDYQTIKDGGVVTVTDSLVAGHTHTYVIHK
jgi:ABC-type glycerol-3-phosphate transport system substrate-binding protein